jgi:hypothetical protein
MEQAKAERSANGFVRAETMRRLFRAFDRYQEFVEGERMLDAFAELSAGS